MVLVAGDCRRLAWRWVLCFHVADRTQVLSSFYHNGIHLNPMGTLLALQFGCRSYGLCCADVYSGVTNSFVRHLSCNNVVFHKSSGECQ